MRKEKSDNIAGRVIDETLLDEMNSQPYGTKDSMTYYDIYNFVGFAIDTMSSVEISRETSGELYDILSERLNPYYFKQEGYSEREKTYWSNQANNILSTPITYNGYYEGWHQIVVMMKVLVYMMVLFVAIGQSDIFTFENTRKTDHLIFSSKYGKHRLYWAKICAGMTISVCFTVLLITVFVGTVAAVYGLEGFDTMLQFVLLRPFQLSIGQAAVILFILLIIASALVSVFAMVLSQATKNSISTISIIAAMLMISLFMSEVPDNIRWLPELWYLLPANFINLNGAFRYPLLTIFAKELVTYQYGFLAYILSTAVFIICGRWLYGRYQINAR